MFSVLALMWMVPASHAFCGTYVGQAGAGLYNQASQVVMVRQGLQTTLTLANDFEGDLEDFVLVVPVPLVLAEEDVDVVDPEIITRVETYSAPRLVQYSCDDFLEEDLAGTGYDGSGDEDGEGAISASVEAEFSAGEFDIVILSAEQSEGLLSWLNSHGYAVPAESTEILQEYIDGGSYFLAAKVDPADLPDGQTWLRPLQVTYSTSGMSLPLRLGALNSPGVQDLLVYVINDQAEGWYRQLHGGDGRTRMHGRPARRRNWNGLRRLLGGGL